MPAPANEGSGKIKSDRALHVVSRQRILPPQRLARNTGTNAIRTALRERLPVKGVVLDYTTLIANQTNFTFQGDTTYYVRDDYYLLGTTTIEGGTVIKMDEGRIFIDLNGSLVCQTASYRPGVFTSYNDNSLGEPISGSSGTPEIGDVFVALSIDSTNATLNNLRFEYFNYGIFHYWPSEPALLDVWNCQFLNGDLAIYGYNMGLHNTLFGNQGYYGEPTLAVEGPSLVGENVTADTATCFLEPDYGASTAIALTNCLITSQPFVSGVALTDCSTNSTVCLPSPTAPVYQTVGGGSYYLTNGSPYRGMGVASINPTLAAELATKTTWPPTNFVVPGIYLGTNVTFSPYALRDTNAAPDLGYHYDPLDYLVGVVYATNVTITVNPGTALGFYGAGGGYNFGLAIATNSSLVCQGAPNSPAWLVAYNTVQEQTPTNWVTPLYMVAHYDDSPNYQITTRFSHWSSLVQDDYEFYAGTGTNALDFRDSEFYDGQIIGGNPTLNFTNCLFWRVQNYVQCIDDNVPVVRDNTFVGGAFGFYSANTTNLVVRDNLFDETSLPYGVVDGGSSYYGGHNAYVTNCDQISPSLPGDLVLTSSPAYQSGALGNYYLPPGSPLLNAGSATADQLALYHYTTQTNQVPETNSVVDIGYHYVATDAYGNPLDSNGDGIPDYLEDPAGAGAPLSITLLAPTNSAFYVEPANIPMQASVFDWSGIVTNVEFYNGSTSVCAVATSPFTFTWPVIPHGAYTIMATAADNKGATAVSTSASITVTNLCGD